MMNKLNKDLISVIVPVYNTQDYLSFCIDSLLEQSYTNLEILLVDDGSTDDSLNICMNYATLDSRCKVFHQKNQGVGAARNLGLQHAQGEFISFVDSDDFIHPDMFQILHDNIQKDSYDVSMVNYRYTTNHDEYHNVNEYTTREILKDECMSYLYNVKPKSCPKLNELIFIILCNKLYRRQLLQGLNFTSLRRSEDLFFNNKVFLRVTKVIFIDTPMYSYFMRSSSVTHSVNESSLDRILAHYQCLDDIPLQEMKYRGYCLMKLYKVISNTYYTVRNTNFHNKAFNMIKEVVQNTIQEFKKNTSIPFYMKSILILFYRYPKAYSFFMWLCDLRVRLLS